MRQYGMKSFLVFVLAFLASMALSAQQAKRVYITLDVSGSMTGNKYALANYTTQMIVTLCEDEDEVYMIVYGEEECLSKHSSPLKVIQKPMLELKFGSPRSSESQFDDIIGFNRVYKPSDKKQNWLFIIGDGVWGTEAERFKTDRDKFREIIEGGTLNVCYLQTEHTMDTITDFTVFADSLGVVDIGKSDTNPSTIKKGCDHFARKILGFSETPLKVKKSGQKCISIKAELPLKEFYLVCQDEVTPEKLPKIETVASGGKSLQATLKGTPTTASLKTQRNEVDLSGHVYHVKSSSIIPANTEIEVCFDKEIDPDNVIIYPLVENMEFGSMCLTQAGGKLKQLDSRTSTICRDESKATVRIELNKESAENLPETLIKKTKVVVKANNKEYETKYKNGGFECDIDLIDDETQYYAECDCPGYFKRVTPISKIVKGDCDPVKPAEMEVREMPVSKLNSMTFEELKRDGIRLRIQDEQSRETLNPELFDITYEIENDFLYEEPKMHFENDTIVLEVRPKGEWCECLFPESLNIKMISTPKDSAFEEYGKNYTQTVFPLQLEVVKDRPWLSRCLWVLITLIVLLLLFFYLWALQKKRRFKKNAMVKAFYYDYYGNLREGECPNLRREGLGAWFARWFLPGDERNTLSFDKPTTSLRFVAADSNEVVNIPKDGNIDPETMRISGYDPKRDQKPKLPVKLGNQGKIYMMNPDGNDQGYLVFTSGDATDGMGYRVIIGLLMAISIIAFAVMLYLVTRSFF